MKMIVSPAEKENPQSIVPILLCAGLYFFANIQRVSIPGTFFNELQQDLQAGASAVTGLGSAFMYAYAFTQLFSGLLAERFGGIRVISWCGLLFCAGGLFLPLSHTLAGMMIARIVTGIGAGLLYLSITSEIMHFWGKNGGIVISLLVMTGFFGGVIANAPFALIAARITCRTLLLVTGCLTAVCYLLFLLFSRGARREGVPLPGGILTTYVSVLKQPNNRFLFAMSGINFGLFYVIQTVIGKKFLEDCAHYSVSAAAWSLSGVGIISCFSGLGMVLVIRRNGGRRKGVILTAAGNTLFVYAVIFFLLLSGSFLPAAAGFLLLQAVTSSLSSVIIPFLYETNPKASVGAAVSILNFCFYLSVALFGNLTGFILERFPGTASSGRVLYSPEAYLTLFGIFGLFALISFFSALKIREAHSVS